MTRSVRIDIDLNAIRHNYSLAKTLSGTRAFAVVKSNAYGHGAVAVAKALAEADGFAVVTTAEALELRDAGIAAPILVLQGPQSAQEFVQYQHHRLMPVLHQPDQVAWLEEQSNLDVLDVWLKVDTGMGRLGVSLEEASQLLSTKTPLWHGVLTHFACADDPGNTHTQQQISRFQQLLAKHKLNTSLANSAGIMAWPESHQGWSRPGIMLYGANPLLTELPDKCHLKPAMRVCAPVIAVKQLAKGSGVGYSQTYICERDMRVGYIGIGYGDGLPRVLNPTATVRLKDIECPIIGRVSMDSIAVDLSALDGRSVTVGDWATLWGPDHPVELMAKAAGTISYEIVTGIRGNPNYLE